MELPEIPWRDRGGFPFEYCRGGWTWSEAESASDAPIGVHERIIPFHGYGIYGTDVDACAASRALLFIRFPDEVGGNEDIPGYSPPLNSPHRPTAAPATITGMFDLLTGIIDHMNETRLFRLPDDRKGL